MSYRYTRKELKVANEINKLKDIERHQRIRKGKDWERTFSSGQFESIN